ncbi:MAG: M50 family metallopeptidase, partial [Holophagales bacterium]|nr:M50 family metallopeptidase [Holophagales bacterium]
MSGAAQGRSRATPARRPTAGTARRFSRNARTALVLAGAATGILYLIPHGHYVIYPLMLLSTLAHEMGHGVAALLVGGRFHAFHMWPDGSGVALWSAEPGRLRLALVAAGGLVGPALVAAFGFLGARTARGARTLLAVAVFLLALSLVLVVRGTFGWIFVLVLTAGLFFAARKGPDDLVQLVVVFLALQLALSVFSRADYLFVAEARTAQGIMPSDVARMAEALWLPYWFWGGVCGAVSLAVLLVGLRGL